MQTALSSFSIWQPPWGSCLNCHARPHHIEAGVVYCKVADYHGPPKPERSCLHWWPGEPLDLWPPLAPNYSTPKKWLHIGELDEDIARAAMSWSAAFPGRKEVARGVAKQARKIMSLARSQNIRPSAVRGAIDDYEAFFLAVDGLRLKDVA